MGRISDDDVQRVQHANDIVQVIQSYLGPLKRSGSGYKAVCPFHEEKTPSFHVNPAKQFYHCFGCKAGGDVISFVRAQEKLDFLDAVRLLADRAGIVLREEQGEASPRQRLLEANAWAADFFRELLERSPEGAAAREYVEKRRIAPKTAAEFRLGFAHPAWDRLLSAARGKGFAPELLEQAGLVIRRKEGGPGWYDRFRNRLMFPILDPRHQVIGFGARTLDGSEPKYLNSPETPLFSKRRALYGLNLAKEGASESRRLFLVEGYTDVMMARQHGVEGVVATLGTALTREHLGVLRRYCDTVVLVFDGDQAGAKASERSTELLLSEECELRIARLPAGEDPCDTLVRGGAEPFRRCLDGSQELFEFLLETATAGRDLGAVADRARAADHLLEKVARIGNPVRREMLARRTAEVFQVSESAIRGRLEQMQGGAAREAPAKPAAPRPAAPAARTPDETVGEKLLAVALLAPGLLARLREQVPLERFPGPGARAIAEAVYALADRGQPPGPADVLARLGDPAAMTRVTALLAAEPEDGDFEAILGECLKWIARRDVQQRIQEAKTRGDWSAVTQLMAQLSD